MSMTFKQRVKENEKLEQRRREERLEMDRRMSLARSISDVTIRAAASHVLRLVKKGDTTCIAEIEKLVGIFNEAVALVARNRE